MSELSPTEDATVFSFKNENWMLVERYIAKYPSDWRLVFKRGLTTLDIQVPEEVWRAFDAFRNIGENNGN